MESGREFRREGVWRKTKGKREVGRRKGCGSNREGENEDRRIEEKGREEKEGSCDKGMEREKMEGMR